MSGRLSNITRRAATVYGVLIVAIAVAAWLAYTSIYGTSSSSASGVARTVTVARGTVQSSVSASGNVSAAASASPTFATSGTLTALTIAVGDRVRKGQVLAKIDATQAKATLASDQASLKSAESALAAAQAGGTAAQRAQNASSLTSAKLQLTSATQTLTANEATLAAAKKQLAADLLLGCVASSSNSGSTGAATSSSTSSPSSTGTTSSSSSTTTPSSTSTRTTQSLSAATTDAPTVATGSTGDVTTKAVTLTGTVSPQGLATTYVFQYGRKASFGSTTRAISAGSGTSAVTAQATIGDLKPATTYIYRLVAKNAEGTSAGLAQTFTTATTSCSTDRTAIASAERTVAQQKLTVAQQQQSVASAQASVTSSVDAATVAQDAAQVTQAKLTVASAAKAVRETVLRAPIGGTITAVNASVGDSVGSSSSASSSGGGATAGGATSSTASSSSSSSGLVTIANLAKLEVVAGFAEADATKIKIGQAATVTLSALPNTTVSGKVTAVSPTSTVTSNVVTYDVTIALVDPSSSVRNGMTADVSVIVSNKANVLELPSAAITTAGRGSTVTILSGGKQTIATVTTGLVGTSTTQILTGVKSGDVVVEPTVSVTAGTTTSSSSNSLTGGGFAGAGGPGGGGGPP